MHAHQFWLLPTIFPVFVWIKRIIKQKSRSTQCKLLFNVNGSLIFLSFPVLMDRLYYWISEIISLDEFNCFIKQSLEDLISKFWCFFTCICEISLPLSITVYIHFYTLSKLFFYFYSFVSIVPPFLMSLVLMDSSRECF